jgi:DNA repair exonuclease SbcCD ATPase subunit
MFKLKNITVKNFMSVGAQTQAVDFDQDHLTLVLGVNLDLGGTDSGERNGTGKTTIINALSYALYGHILRSEVRKENLINLINGKGMLVTVEFEQNGINYRIERGRKPNILKFYVNNEEQTAEDNDEAQGDSRETQKQIERLLNMSHTMFKHLVALNTYTEPFLSLKPNDQREVIEQLLGITLLSEKAEVLKQNLKDTKDNIQAETFKIEGIKKANENVQKSIESLALKSSAWNNKKADDIVKLGLAIADLEGVDIDNELNQHEKLKSYDEQAARIKSLKKESATLEAALSQAERTVKKYEKELAALKDKKCHACEQELQDHKHGEMTESARKHLEEAGTYLDTINADLVKVNSELEKIGDINGRPNTYYESLTEALGHKNNLANLMAELERKDKEENPYDEQIEELKNSALQEIEWDTVNTLVKLRDHQDFLLKLLTNKDSFIRKKIIDQNLTFLNKRLNYYVDRLGLPHTVVFQNDLSVLITQLGKDIDFYNLSRGEGNRVILATSFAFRDVWENLYQHINLLFIDELLDNGTDASGVEKSLAILKKMARERNKNIFIISHRDELLGRVDSTLKVIKENGFTSYENSAEPV